MYDLAIIGAGAAGIECVKRALSSGLKTVIIEINKESFGGTCLNKGCIPTKFFLNFSKFNKSWEELSKEKNQIIQVIESALINYLEKQGVDFEWGKASFLDEHTLGINEKEIKAKNIIIATGSSAKKIFEHNKVILAEELFSLASLPERFLIVGAGYIGLEFASLLNSLNKEVQVIEKEDRILPLFDSALTKRLRVILEKKGIKISTSSDIANYDLENFDIILLATGRVPNAESLSLGNLGLAQQEGWIKTDENLRTNINNIYACGDITGGKLLAYIAEYQARLCIDNITGKEQNQDYSIIPECVFSIPQLARVGLSENQAKEKNLAYRLIKSNFLKFSSSYVYGDKDGFIQLIVGQDDKIIGAEVISNFAAELINTFSLCIKNNLTTKDLKESIFIHPTISEIINLLLNQ